MVVIILNLQFSSRDTHCYVVSVHPWENCCLALKKKTTYMPGPVFIRTPGSSPSSCSAVLTAIHGPLHLRRRQHYQPPPSLWWQLSSLCLPGLQPLPPPALSLLLFTVPETTQNSDVETWNALCFSMCNICFVSAGCTDQWRRPDVCWDLWSCRQMYDLLNVDKQAQQWSSRWAARAACSQLKAQFVVYSLSFL